MASTSDGASLAAGPLSAAVEATRAEGSARVLRAFTSDGRRAPETADVLGEGVADLRLDRVWIRRRSVTAAAAARVRRPNVPRVVAFVFGALSRRWREVYVEGPRRSKRRRNAGWDEPFPPRDEHGELMVVEGLDCELAEALQSPLWPLKPISRLSAEPRQLDAGELIRGEPVTVHMGALTSAEMSPAVWEELAQPDAPGPPARPSWRRPPPYAIAREAVPFLVWLDAERRIRRIAVEWAAYHQLDASGRPHRFEPSWSVTELWDFGVGVERLPPPRRGETGPSLRAVASSASHPAADHDPLRRSLGPSTGCPSRLSRPARPGTRAPAG